MKTGFRLLAVLAGFFFAGSAHALNPGDHVDNFRLLDHTGASHELYYFSDAKAVVMMTYGNGEVVCTGCQVNLTGLRMASAAPSSAPAALCASGKERVRLATMLADVRQLMPGRTRIRAFKPAEAGAELV